MRKVDLDINSRVKSKRGVYYIDSPSVDAFSRARVSNPVTIFDSQLTYDLQPLLFEQITTGNGAIAHSATNRCANIAITEAVDTSDTAFMQTYSHFRYQPSKSQLVFITFNLRGTQAGITKIAGYSDGTNGFELRLVDGVLQFAILSSTDAGDQVASQSNWNLNRFDGTNENNPRFDATKTHILVIDFQALYVGRVCFGFDIGGSIVYAHEFNNANVQTHPYIATANLPIRVGMISTVAGATGQMDYICSAVVSEGGSDETIGYGFSTAHEVTVASAEETHVVSVQPKTLFNGFANRIKFELDSIDFAVKGNNPVTFKVCLGQALTTTTVSDVNATYSGFSKVIGTVSGEPAIIVSQTSVTATANTKAVLSKQVINRYPITLDTAGALRDLGRLSVTGRADTGTSVSKVIINWREVR